MNGTKSFHIGRLTALALVALSWGVAGAGQTSGNPLDWTGPVFLVFFLSLLAAGFTLAALLRYALRRPVDEPTEDDIHLDAYDAAYLAGGERQATSAALASLLHQNALEAKSAERKVLVKGPLPEGAHPLERTLYQAVPPGGSLVGDVRNAAGLLLSYSHERLEERGLLMKAEQGRKARWYPFLLMLAILLFGLVKVFVGVGRDKPVVFLVLILVAGVVVTCVTLGRAVRRSRRGDAVLDELRRRQSALEATARTCPDVLAGQDFTVAMCLFGTGILATTAMDDLHTSVTPPRHSSGGCGGGCGGGGGGGCGGGGGGCGGGGCGGCGGGGCGGGG